MTLIEAKLKAICDWTKPQNVRDIQSFPSFTNYYRRFIRNFASAAGAVTDLTGKGVLWQWGPY